jgi:hypothetical protein
MIPLPLAPLAALRERLAAAFGRHAGIRIAPSPHPEPAISPASAIKEI